MYLQTSFLSTLAISTFVTSVMLSILVLYKGLPNKGTLLMGYKVLIVESVSDHGVRSRLPGAKSGLIKKRGSRFSFGPFLLQYRQVSSIVE